MSGKSLHPVKGKVLRADGKPLTSGRIVFVAAETTITSTATIESDGGFQFKGSSGDGLPAGEYRVRIEFGTPASGAKGTKSQADLPFPTKYLDEDTSELTATVTTDESKNNFEFKLNQNKPAAQAGGSRDGR
jgi:hypothetical protein